MQFLTQQVLGDRSLCLNNHQRMLVTLITTLWITRLMETPLPLRGQLAHPPQCDLCCPDLGSVNTIHTAPGVPKPKGLFPFEHRNRAGYQGLPADLKCFGRRLPAGRSQRGMQGKKEASWVMRGERGGGRGLEGSHPRGPTLCAWASAAWPLTPGTGPGPGV